MASDLLAGDLPLLRQLVDGRLRNLQVDAEFIDRQYLTESIAHCSAPAALRPNRCGLATPRYYVLLLVAVNPVRKRRRFCAIRLRLIEHGPVKVALDLRSELSAHRSRFPEA